LAGRRRKRRTPARKGARNRTRPNPANLGRSLREGLASAGRHLAVLAALAASGAILHIVLRPPPPVAVAALEAQAPPVAEATPPVVPPATRTVAPLMPPRSPTPPPTVQVPEQRETTAPAWKRFATAAPPTDGRPMIAIVLDDVGVARRHAENAMTLDPSVTLAFMTYAPDVAAQVAAARARGHEIMMHVPMEPMTRSEDPGPNALVTGLKTAELARRIDWNLARFDGYVGVNNHMGSRFTSDRAGMEQVMAALRRRGLLFIDSRTTAQTVAADEARRQGVPAASRDVFLDNEVDARGIEAQLAETERKARAQGAAIAIGHPHPETVAALRRWIPQARARGFVLVPVTAVVARGLTG
jgi:polysaccharide deacetylase 2 family uncharacterized protein YibQ